MATTDPEDREIDLVAVFSPNAVAMLPLRGLPPGPAGVRLQGGRRGDWPGLQRYPFDQILPNSFGPEDL